MRDKSLDGAWWYVWIFISFVWQFVWIEISWKLVLLNIYDVIKLRQQDTFAQYVFASGLLQNKQILCILK